MTTLDTLARSAVVAIEDSVADLPVPLVPAAAAPVAASAVIWSTAKYALAGAAAAVAVLVALVIVAPTGDVTDVPTTTVATTTTVPVTAPTTIPDLDPPPDSTPVPAVPVVPPSDAGGADATTTTLPDTTPPPLVVLSPTDGEHVDGAVQTFTGTTEPGASVVASGKFPATVGADGAWSVGLVLAPGANGVRFVATDAAGNATEVRITVHFDAPTAEDPPEDPKEPEEGTTTTTKAATWEFSAWQTYGSCSEPLPYDVFGGTATPGSTVTVTSPHGSGSTVVAADGSWSLRVDFPSAPYNVPFEVKVKDAFGSKKVFPFVSLYEG